MLRRRAQEIIDLTVKAEKELRHEAEVVSGEISIGCGETRNMKPLSEMMASFRQKYPDVSFHIYTAIADDVTERLESGILDMGLLLEPVEISRYRYIRMPLEERWSVLMRKDSILAEKERIAPGDLAGVPLILAKRQSVRNKLENWFGRSAKDMRVVCTCNLSHHNMMDMVESGILDPVKVTRSALQNATSVASTLLTTESAVANIKEDTPAMPAGGAGMGGMM